MNLSINRTISLKVNTQSQLTHFQNDIFTYLCLTVALKALGTQRKCISHESEDAIKMYFLDQKYMLSKIHAKRFAAE